MCCLLGFLLTQKYTQLPSMNELIYKYLFILQTFVFKHLQAAFRSPTSSHLPSHLLHTLFLKPVTITSFSTLSSLPTFIILAVKSLSALLATHRYSMLYVQSPQLVGDWPFWCADVHIQAKVN